MRESAAFLTPCTFFGCCEQRIHQLLTIRPDEGRAKARDVVLVLRLCLVLGIDLARLVHCS